MKKKQMKFIFSLLFVGALAVMFLFLKKNFTVDKPLPVISPADFVDSKRHALDLLGGLMNHGFRVRDEVWEVSLASKKLELLEITLFAGNQYWFAAAASEPAQRLKLALYDDMGNPVALDLWKDDHLIPGARIAGGVVISHSGNYYIGIELMDEEGEDPVPTSLVYAYQ